jgi:arylsulfatase A-like enzyme
LFFDKALLLSPQIVWMIPATTVVLCLVLAVSMVCAALILPKRIVKPVALFALAFLAALGPLVAIPRMHYIATLLLAMGLASQLARFQMTRADGYLAIMRRAITWMSVLVIALGLGVNGLHFLETRRAVAALPQARENAPNVLLIVMDTVRAQSLSLYGYGKSTTPGLESLAQTGVVFDSALAAAPWTLPSHASMFTGHWPHELNVDWRTPLDGTYTTLAEALKGQGYVTAGFISNLIYGSAAHGLDRGFVYYRDFPVSLGEAIVSSSLLNLVSSSSRVRNRLNYHRVLNRKTVEDINAEFLNWLSNTGQRPFFGFLNYMDAHEPYLPPEGFADRFGPPRKNAVFEHSAVDAFRPAKWEMSPAEVQSEVAEYDGAIAYIDRELTQLIDELAKRGLLENTVLIVTSDHGEHIGEHRLFGHGNSLYRTVLGVPLLISFPGHVPAGAVVRKPVTLRDIPATVMDLIGSSSSSTFPGLSLSRYWQSKGDLGPDGLVISEAGKRVFGAQRSWYPLTKGDMRSIVSAGYHYIQNDNGDEELYDFAKDPAELDNLAVSNEGQSAMRLLRESLTAELHKSPSPK